MQARAAIPSDTKNLYARFSKVLNADVAVASGGSFDITPDITEANTFPVGVIGYDPLDNVLRCGNTEQLNLQIRVFFKLSSGSLALYDVALQRGNEAQGIEVTKMPVFRRPTRGGAVGGPTAVVLNTFTSGPSDPFNVAGFKLTFFNPSGQSINILQPGIRVDVFGVS